MKLNCVAVAIGALLLATTTALAAGFSEVGITDLDGPPIETRNLVAERSEAIQELQHVAWIASASRIGLVRLAH
jgi:hypothetical protein